MATTPEDEREIRAARNQAMFRSVNEKLKEINDAFAAVAGSYSIACECADSGCLELIEMSADAYADIRRHPRRFAVRHGHVYPEIELVVAEFDGYSVVEKMGEAAAIVEAAASHLEIVDARGNL